ncbi:tRNA lysidine(34) synthetase TilS [Anaerovorax odorimutans]|uniref:tRNA lysidine(34) synthetase TilS n=1 Tax=Anaerovorax odorimutans TaxID=109327 RepID=UPI00040490C0|nr:tRNA lysidine(34) synthetase TilS [Anaerovorax odorimutans]
MWKQYNKIMIIEKVKNTILNNGLLEKGEHIVIGLSGGPDSVCLFHVLNEIREEFNITLHAVHVNHQFRPGAAEEDQNYVELLCKKYDIPCYSFTYDVNKIASDEGISGEEAGRNVRYKSFYKIANKINSQKVKIAVAQNLNDQAETLLMRIIRGTGTDGLSGIEYMRSGEGGFSIIRPLLDISRKEIEEYCAVNNLNPRIDHTNLQAIYTRNKVRLELIPYIEENFNKNIMLALNRLANIAKEDKEYIYSVVDKIIEKYAKQNEENLISIDLNILKNLYPAVRNRVIIRLFKKIGLIQDISAVHLKAAENILEEAKTSSSVDFPNDYGIRISYGNAELYKKNDDKDNYYELNGYLKSKILMDLKNICLNENTQAFDYDKIKNSGCKLILRTRKQGDYICPKGMKGTKKLQDFFVDAKIKKERRDFIPLVCLGSEVIWIIGYRISENYRLKEETAHILLLEYSI